MNRIRAGPEIRATPFAEWAHIWRSGELAYGHRSYLAKRSGRSSFREVLGLIRLSVSTLFGKSAALAANRKPQHCQRKLARNRKQPRLGLSPAKCGAYANFESNPPASCGPTSAENGRLH